MGQQQRRIEESGRGGKLHWPFIAAQMGRSQPDVVRQHALQYNASLRHGTFTPEEDAHILKRYREWHSTYPGQPGLWVALEKEMSRKDKRISERWRHVLAKRHAVDSQTVEFTPGDGNITIGDLLYGNVNLDDVGTAGASASAGIAIMCGEDREGDGREKGNNMGEYQQQQSAAGTAEAESWVVGVGKKRGLHQAFSPEPLITGLIRWDDALVCYFIVVGIASSSDSFE